MPETRRQSHGKSDVPMPAAAFPSRAAAASMSCASAAPPRAAGSLGTAAALAVATLGRGAPAPGAADGRAEGDTRGMGVGRAVLVAGLGGRAVLAAGLG